jgi:hypothetical protein
VYGASIYDTKEVPQEPPIDEEVELEEGTEQLKQAELRVRKEEVWREMFLTSNGRDKAFVRLPLVSLGFLSSTLLFFHTETDTILAKSVSTFSHFAGDQPSVTATDAFPMGQRAGPSTQLHGRRALVYEVGFRNMPPARV